MPPAAQALDVAMHIRSEPEADPVALAHEMISLLLSVRTPGGAVSAWPRQIADYERRRIGVATQVIARRSPGSGVLVATRLCGNHGVVHHLVQPWTRLTVPLCWADVLE